MEVKTRTQLLAYVWSSKEIEMTHARPLYALRYLGLTTILLLVAAFWNQSNAQHEYPAPETAPAKLSLDNGKKWPTDAPLR